MSVLAAASAAAAAALAIADSVSAVGDVMTREVVDCVTEVIVIASACDGDVDALLRDAATLLAEVAAGATCACVCNVERVVDAAAAGVGASFAGELGALAATPGVAPAVCWRFPLVEDDLPLLRLDFASSASSS